MANVIDVKTLSKEELFGLIRNLITEKLITHEFLVEVANNNYNNIDDISEIDALISKHFEEYDEVFRKLA